MKPWQIIVTLAAITCFFSCCMPQPSTGKDSTGEVPAATSLQLFDNKMACMCCIATIMTCVWAAFTSE